MRGLGPAQRAARPRPVIGSLADKAQIAADLLGTGNLGSHLLRHTEQVVERVADGTARSEPHGMNLCYLPIPSAVP